jgi:hypothetical protein
MKNIKIIITLFIFTFTFTVIACENILEEEVFSQLGPSNFFKTAEDAEALLNAVYATSQGNPDRLVNYLLFGEIPTDILLERQGGINRHFRPIEDFTWDATHQRLTNEWNNQYKVIYNANVLLDNVPSIQMNDDRKKEILSEARFLRAFSYFYLYDLFGPTPLITSSHSSIDDRPERATKEAFLAFVETELRESNKDLPPAAEQSGRASKGAALGLLTKFYLNNKKWKEAAATAQEVMDLGTYFIFKGNKRSDLFALENEGNMELIFVRPYIPQPVFGNSYISHAAPPNYQYKYPPKVNFAAQFKIRSEFLKLFEPEDERLEAFIFEYINTSGETVVLGQDDVRSFKYPEDPEAVRQFNGNDIPLLRYADILLSRAEALNELNGPNQESINLINEIKDAAGVELIDLDDFPDKQSLRDHILDERGREFHTEALRRQDLIRHGKFIKMAKERGKQAFEYHVRYPIPQSEIDKNPNLVQNDGYNE